MATAFVRWDLSRLRGPAVGQDRMQRSWIGILPELHPRRIIAQRARDGGKRLQMLDTCVLGREKREDQIYRNTVDGVEVKRALKAQEHASYLVKPVDARMWQRNPVADAGRAEDLALLQCVDRCRGFNSIDRLCNLGQVLEETTLKGGVP